MSFSYARLAKTQLIRSSLMTSGTAADLQARLLESASRIGVACSDEPSIACEVLCSLPRVSSAPFLLNRGSMRTNPAMGPQVQDFVLIR